tara:strand:- start:1805 stop:2467 length:663 start_codon:yes stop_codon:yes gene_type:complete
MNLEELHKKLSGHLEQQMKNYSSFVYAQEKGFYQGFEEIGIEGCRPTEKRFERYKIEKYLSKDQIALDIGSNCGFLTIHIAKFMHSIDGVEINPFLVDIGKDTSEFLELKNVNFHSSSFENFEVAKKYDVVFSLANDETIDGNTKFTFAEYIKKIIGLLNDNGLLMFETVSTDTFEPRIFKPKLEFLKKYFTIVEERMVKSEYPLKVPMRRFFVFKKLIK